MFDIGLLLLFLQGSPIPNAQAASLPLKFRNAPSTPTATGNVATANHASISLTNSSNDICLLFTNLGDHIPDAEVRHTLSIASAHLQAYLPRYANEPISNNYFETKVSFPETGDDVSLSVYAYGFGLSWLQLSYGLMLLQRYMLGLGSGHPNTHYQQLEFYVQLTAGIEVAHGVVEFATGARAVAKRNLITLPLPHANYSSLGTPALSIIFNIPKSNLDLNIISLGAPIPQSAILTTIESAFTEIILDHTDIDAPIPANEPYSFNATFGRSPQQFVTGIVISPNSDQQFSWGLLCILIYGLRDFMRETEHFNVLSFEIRDARLGWIGHGKVLYWPASETLSTEELALE
ncbi:MAG: hypothetical protein ASARMPREDX12_002047 [Alectoria sarmentosa]|nr:MAG: hypothetical protein ASARMPREDX12_002047 [Alectoria sarmentosa]